MMQMGAQGNGRPHPSPLPVVPLHGTGRGGDGYPRGDKEESLPSPTERTQGAGALLPLCVPRGRFSLCGPAGSRHRAHTGLGPPGAPLSPCATRLCVAVHEPQ